MSTIDIFYRRDMIMESLDLDLLPLTEGIGSNIANAFNRIRKAISNFFKNLIDRIKNLFNRNTPINKEIIENIENKEEQVQNIKEAKNDGIKPLNPDEMKRPDKISKRIKEFDADYTVAKKQLMNPFDAINRIDSIIHDFINNASKLVSTRDITSDDCDSILYKICESDTSDIVPKIYSFYFGDNSINKFSDYDPEILSIYYNSYKKLSSGLEKSRKKFMDEIDQNQEAAKSFDGDIAMTYNNYVYIYNIALIIQKSSIKGFMLAYADAITILKTTYCINSNDGEFY